MTYSKILSIPHTKILLASACIVVILTLYVEPVIALYLHNVYSLSNASIGVFFLASAMTYIVGSPLASYFSQVFNRKAVIIMAFGLMTLQSALLGPSALLGLPDSLVLVCLGDLLIGLCLSLALIPLLSELIDLLEKEKRFSPDSLSDMCSALFNSMFNLGNLLSPLIAAVMHDSYGYKCTTDAMMILALVYTGILALTLISKK